MKKYAKFCEEKLIQKLQIVFKLSKKAVGSVTICLKYIIPKSAKTYTIFLYLDSILASFWLIFAIFGTLITFIIDDFLYLEVPYASKPIQNLQRKTMKQLSILPRWVFCVTNDQNVKTFR